MSDEYIEHHGIMGMKWGVRRTPEQLGHKKKITKNKAAQSKPKPKAKSDSGTSQSVSLKKMSDEELRRRINRLQMERQYKDLTKKELSAGQKWVNSVLNESSKKIATAYLTKLATNALDSALSGGTKKTAEKKK